MQTKIGRRIVIIGRTSITATTRCRRETDSRQRATPRRTDVIKDGQFVGGRPGR
jgi:hypothetical protein